ncbi:hemerythrin domain-containing protein [Paenibacillus sp. YYML68]|uniref:hemerythrin domain-containing protein n=1 Tax=Paenibacillus sp. YYML68 TaxID=2909250 RepID=UPI00248FE82E|nr:hemerythrin domain-containing protein [Paenibacillus sp. YYML68]
MIIQDMTLSWERLNNEHAVLNEMVAELEKDAKETMQLEGELLHSLTEQLRMKAVGLLTELEYHSEWEASDLFPKLTDHYNTPEGHQIITSLWMLEKEHELTHEYFQSFFEELDRLLDNSSAADLPRAVNDLLTACRLVREHLMAEEETLLPFMEAELRLEDVLSIPVTCVTV